MAVLHEFDGIAYLTLSEDTKYNHPGNIQAGWGGLSTGTHMIMINGGPWATHP